MKIWVFLGLGVYTLTGCKPTTNKYLETEAIATLDALTDAIGKFNSCSLRVTSEVTENDNGQTTHRTLQSDVYLRGNNRMHVYSSIDDARKAFWYNGKELAIFRFDDQQYDISKAPATTLAMIDSLHNTYNIDFPSADILYPTLTDDVIAHFDSVFYLPEQEVNGQLCVGVHALNDSLNVSLFVDKVTYLPVQLVILGQRSRSGESFIANYQHWQINPKLGDELFEFIPPKSATRANIFKKIATP